MCIFYGKYSVQLKLKAIEDWREGKMPISEIIIKYNISPQTLNRWVSEYYSQGIDGLVRKPKNKIHIDEFKQTVVEDMRKNGLTQSEVSRKYSIGRRQVQVWERIYLQEGSKGLYIERRGIGLKLDAPEEKTTLDKTV